jgi:hypothetical protein
MKFTTLVAAVSSLALFVVAQTAHADGTYYGTVESFGGGTVVVKTTKHSIGTWKIGANSKVTGSIASADWVFVDVETSGHVKTLRMEEHPTQHSGVVKGVRGKVFSVHSGVRVENWNLMETTIMSGISESDVAVGDEIDVKVYKNHNLAEVKLIKRGVK